MASLRHGMLSVPKPIPKFKPQIPPISQILGGDERTNLFVAKLQGIYNRNLYS